MPNDALDRTTRALAELGGQRVWSLMVTIFGDLAQTRNSAIEGPVMSAIMAEMHIRPEAVRVALHRLRNDGWITSEKTGRTSLHSLTELGRAQSVAASARIYANPGEEGKAWQLALIEEASNVTRGQMLSLGFAPLMPRVYIGGSDARAPEGALTLPGGPVPDWLRSQFVPEGLASDYAALHSVLLEAESTLTGPKELSPLQTAVLRCLIVHNWRRIVLKHPSLPAHLYPPTWEGPRCHVLVNTLLNRFPRPRLDEIAQG